jgi:hypothetical protein
MFPGSHQQNDAHRLESINLGSEQLSHKYEFLGGQRMTGLRPAVTLTVSLLWIHRALERHRTPAPIGSRMMPTVIAVSC